MPALKTKINKITTNKFLSKHKLTNNKKKVPKKFLSKHNLTIHKQVPLKTQLTTGALHLPTQEPADGQIRGEAHGAARQPQQGNIHRQAGSPVHSGGQP